MSLETPPEPPPVPPSIPLAPPVRPAGGESEGPRLPWEDRDQLGFLDALIETVKLLVMAPGEAFSRLRQDGDLIWPLIFGLIFSWVGQCFGQMWGYLFGQAMPGMTTGFEGIEGFENFALLTGLTGGSSLIWAFIWIVLWPILFIIGIFIGAAILHLCLMIVGATNDSPMGFEGTLKVIAYSQIASLAAVIPLAGGLAAMVGSMVLTAIGFCHVHKTTQGKAVVAVLIPVAVCCLCCVLVFFLVLGSGFAAALMAAGG